MLHRIELPLEPDELASVFALQVQLMELACIVDDTLDRAAIEAYLDDPDIVDWVMNSYERTVGVLNQFAQECPDDVKEQVLEELQSDYAFWDFRDDASFEFRFVATDPHRELIARWLRGYFEQFGRGIDAAVTGTRLISKSVWLDAFRHANPRIQTCPFCDGSMKSAVTVEHFLPKGRYPVLSVHAANLVPACKDCNEPKSDKDPLENARLLDLFVPYHRHALDFCDIRVLPTQDGSYEFELVSRNPHESDFEIAIRELERLVEVPGQWNKNIDEIVNLAIAKIEEQLDADRDEGIVVQTTVEFRERLDKLCERMMRQWGRQHYFVPATGWLVWAKDNYLDTLWAELCTVGTPAPS